MLPPGSSASAISAVTCLPTGSRWTRTSARRGGSGPCRTTRHGPPARATARVCRASRSPLVSARPVRAVSARPGGRGDVMTEPGHAVRDYLHDAVDTLLDDLAAWVRIPSVSADPAHERDVTRSARSLQAHLRETGFPRWRSGTPTVCRRCSPTGRPRIPARRRSWSTAITASAPSRTRNGRTSVHGYVADAAEVRGGSGRGPGRRTARLGRHAPAAPHGGCRRYRP